jgi:hypothetical protein
VAGCCERDIEPSCSLQSGEFFGSSQGGFYSKCWSSAKGNFLCVLYGVSLRTICRQDECNCVPALLQLIPDDRKQPLLVHIEACILVDSKQCRGHSSLHSSRETPQLIGVHGHYSDKLSFVFF